MAKKNKSGSEVEYLRGLIRSQTSKIKSLERDVSRKNKRAQTYEEYLDSAKDFLNEEQVEELENDKCGECGKGKLEIIELGPRKMVICTNCDFRTLKK